MTFEIILLLTLIDVALVFFAFEWISSDVVALGLMLTLGHGGVGSGGQSIVMER